MLMRALPKPFVSAISQFGRSLAAAPHHAGGLLAVGTPDFEPWHLVAHLQDAATWSGNTTLAPALIRHSVPVNAPPHLSIGLDRLAGAGRGETVLVVAPDAAADDLLERLSDTRRRGGTVLALTSGGADGALLDLAHDFAELGADEFEPAMHLVPISAATVSRPARGRPAGRRFVPRLRVGT